jgi:hypothetical protein
MTSVAHPIEDLAARGRAFWLPRQGTGNGLDAAAWALILTDIDPRIVIDLLDTLAAAAVPAFASTTSLPPGHDPRGGVVLWVDKHPLQPRRGHPHDLAQITQRHPVATPTRVARQGR